MSALGIVLDVDDTLYLERDYVRSGFAQVDAWCASELGRDGIGARAWSLFESGVRGSTLTDALAAAGVEVTADLAQQVVRTYREHAPEIEMLPDARDFIARAAAGPHVGVVTDGPAASQRQKVRALGIDAVCSHVVVSSEHGLSKPDPRVFEMVVASWGVSPDEVVYIADNPTKDFDGPRQLGWRGVRVRRPGSLHHALPTPPDVREVSSLSELDDLCEVAEGRAAALEDERWPVATGTTTREGAIHE